MQVESGALREQLFTWLERQVEMLKSVCDYNATLESVALEQDSPQDDEESEQAGSARAYFARRRLSMSVDDQELVLAKHLHETLQHEHAQYTQRVELLRRRQRWLASNQVRHVRQHSVYSFVQ